MSNDKIEDNLDQIEQMVEERLEKRRAGNGFANKKGDLVSRPELHAIGIGVAPMGLAYLLPTPMGELHVLMQLGFMRTGTNKWARGEKMDGHLGDVMHNIGYTVFFSFVTALFFELLIINYLGWSEFGVTSIDVTQIVLAMIGGA